jgi:hypothetical protein
MDTERSRIYPKKGRVDNETNKGLIVLESSTVSQMNAQ